jgi:hypothetical protein
VVVLNRGTDSFSECSAHLFEAYRTLIYRVTKAILSPVMDAVADTITDAVRESIADAFIRH